MKYPVGPRQRRRRKRRAGKLLVLIAVVLMLLSVSTWTTWQPPEEGRPEMSASALGYLCNLATYSPGHADEIQAQYPELTPGEVEALRCLEEAKPGFTAALQERYQEFAWQMEEHHEQ